MNQRFRACLTLALLVITPALAQSVYPDPTPGWLTFEYQCCDREIVMQNGGLMLIGDGRYRPSTPIEIIDPTKVRAQRIAELPDSLASPHGLELKDGSVLVFGGLPQGCGPSYYWSGQCRGIPGQPSYRYLPLEDRWQAIPTLQIRFERGYWWETGNSELSSRWTRNDARIRANGDVVWLDSDATRVDSQDQIYPLKSILNRWSPVTPDMFAEEVAPLRKARTEATLLELSDGRLAVLGGRAQLEHVALDKECIDCPDEFVSIGPFRQARSTEILDESVVPRPVWKPGPTAHYGGGRAIKLANGRIFKLSLAGGFDSEGYRAEVADAAFTRWEKLPPFPLKGVIARNVSVVGNRVVIFTDKDQTVVWNDEAKRWRLWPLRASDAGNPLISLTELPDGDRVLIRYRRSWEVIPLADYTSKE